jgi:hypothetical protein
VGKIRNVCNILVVEPEGKRPFERPRGRWQDTTKMDLQEI